MLCVGSLLLSVEHIIGRVVNEDDAFSRRVSRHHFYRAAIYIVRARRLDLCLFDIGVGGRVDDDIRLMALEDGLQIPKIFKVELAAAYCDDLSDRRQRILQSGSDLPILAK